jgi:hypothetical protein
MQNAQKELLEHVEGRKVELVKIAFMQTYGEELLRIEGTLEEVLPQLNFEYNDGYGSQKLFGYVWYEDGTWSDREEYDGSEWWQYRCCPKRDIVVSQ